MSVTSSVLLLKPHAERDTENLPMQSFFTPPDRSAFHNDDEIKWHVEKTSRNIAVPVRDASADYRLQGLNEFTIHKTVPTCYKLGVKIAANDLIQGIDIGKTEYASKAITERLRTMVAPAITTVVKDYDRAMELYASQLLLTGAVTLTDGTNTLFSEDFEMPDTHKADASVAWTTTGSAVPFTDMLNMANVLVVDALGPVQYALMNGVGFTNMKDTTQFKNGASKDYTGEIYRLRQDRSPINPRLGGGAIFKGVLEIGAQHEIDCYVIDGWYNAIGTGTVTKYIPDNKVIMKCAGRMDQTFGGLQKFGSDKDAAAILRAGGGGASGRLGIKAHSFDLSYNMWLSENKEVFHFGVGTRPALIPIARNCFGVITTKGF